MLRLRPLLLILSASMLAACGGETPTTGSPGLAEPPSELAREAVGRPEAPVTDTAPAPARTVFDAAEAVFDTTELTPAPRINIPTPRQPAPLPLPPPAPAPEPLPVPSPAPPVSGSCDVRESESYCFTYTGAAWSASGAEAHCAEAPDASFRPAECPEEGRIATCVFRRGETPSREILYTYYAPYDLGLARIACPGRFTVIE